jgi:DNA polymerase III delta subunit
MTSRVPTVTVFFGEETYLLDRDKERALSWPDRDITYLSGDQTTEGELISTLSQTTLFGSDTLVILDNANKLKLSKAFTKYLDSRSTESTSLLVAICRSPKVIKCWVGLPDTRYIEHSKFKPWQVDEIKKRMQGEAKSLGFKLSLDAFDLLHKLHSEDLGAFYRDLIKLSFLPRDQSEISYKQALAVCAGYLPIKPWDIVEAALNKQVKRALIYIGLLFTNEGDSVAIPILYGLMQSATQLIQARYLLDRGDDPATIAKALGQHKFTFEKTTLPQAQKHTVASLKKLMKNLCELELKLKNSNHPKRTLIELIAISLAS